MTLAELKTKADAKLADFWSALQTKQEAYYAKHGKYFQLLITPETAVVDGVDSDFTKRSPSDEKHVVDVDFTFTSKIPFQIEVHEWVGVDKGYTAIVWAQLPNGKIYTRNRNSNNVDSGWYQLVGLTAA